MGQKRFIEYLLGWHGDWILIREFECHELCICREPKRQKDRISLVCLCKEVWDVSIVWPSVPLVLLWRVLLPWLLPSLSLSGVWKINKTWVKSYIQLQSLMPGKVQGKDRNLSREHQLVERGLKREILDLRPSIYLLAGYKWYTKTRIITFDTSR